MTVSHEVPQRSWTQPTSYAGSSLTEKFEVLKEIGDGSFGSVALARVRGAGSHIARRGTLVAIKTMKKTFDNFALCLELREIIFLRTLPPHQHLVPALDIFLDPTTKKLHIAMESMDGNLYQLMKARNHKTFDPSSVKSMLFQILSGLEHIHAHNFFHRDVKPENILVSVSGKEDLGSAFKRYSQVLTPPSTPPTYTIKLADFGLAREMHSKSPYTTYVSTRWYRAPEVLLRAGEYSAPVDIWAIGAMAVEIATLKPLFPGSNEVDQVWRVCEIMGSPGNWVNKLGGKVGGGEWREGVKLAQKLGFAFPKMAPHTMETLLQAPQWPASLSNFVTWCLMWDPKSRPTSVQALAHEYFTDAVDPLRPKSSASWLLGRKQSDLSNNTSLDSVPTPTLKTQTSSWFRKSLITRESAPAVTQLVSGSEPLSPRPSPDRQPAAEPALPKVRPTPVKRNTWANGAQITLAPMPILPSIRPVSPLSNTVHAERASPPNPSNDQSVKKIGRQLSAASQSNHYADIHRQEAERALNGQSGLLSPPNGQKESFFSHLRKRARRLSGRNQLPISPPDDLESNAGCAPWAVSNRSSMLIDTPNDSSKAQPDFTELDRVLENVRNTVDAGNTSNTPTVTKHPIRMSSNPMLKRHHSIHHNQDSPASQSTHSLGNGSQSASRLNRRKTQKNKLPTNCYETPDEQEELLDEALTSAHAAVTRLDRQHRISAPHLPMLEISGRPLPVPPRHTSKAAPQLIYPSPSETVNPVVSGLSRNDYTQVAKAIPIQQPQRKTQDAPQWPTPPSEGNEWAAAVAASIFQAGEQWR